MAKNGLEGPGKNYDTLDNTQGEFLASANPEQIDAIRKQQEDPSILVEESLETSIEKCPELKDKVRQQEFQEELMQVSKKNLRIYNQGMQETPPPVNYEDILGFIQSLQNKNSKIVEENGKIVEENDKIVEENDSLQKENDSLQKENDELKNKKDQIKVHTQLTRLKSLTEGLDKNKSYDFVLQFLDKLEKEPDGLKIEEFEAVINRLKSSPTALKEMMQDVKDKTPEKYEEFKSTLISIDAEFKNLLLGQETEIFTEKSLEKAALGVDSGTVEGDGYNISTKQGNHEIKVDFDGERTIANSETGYRIEANTGDKQARTDIQKEKTAYNETINSINEAIDTFSNIQTILTQALSYIETQNNPDITKKALAALNTKLATEYPDYQFTEIKTVDDLKQQITKVQAKRKEEEEKKEKETEKYEKQVQEILAANTEKIKEQDEKKKKILDFLNKIGFDLISQDVTNQIIYEINSSAGLKGKYGFDSKIDIANGNLGINLDNDLGEISFEEQQAFSKFLNKMITGNENYPVSMVNQNEVVFYTTEQKDKQVIDKLGYINEKLGIDPRATINENLKLQENKKQPPEKKNK